MDFDDAKENIQPLAAGRNASILHASLLMESQQELQARRQEFESAIHSYQGDDQLEPWYDYIIWIEQSFPSGGKESGFEEVLTKCLSKFENDERYYQDRRMIKMYIKFIDMHKDICASECYQQLFSRGIGTMVADFYISWAYCCDLAGNYSKANDIFRRGINCRAEPLDELKEAHQHFGFIVSQRLLCKDDENATENANRQLQERRLALSSLRGHRRNVGSIRTGAAVKSYVPGVLKVQADKEETATTRKNNAKVKIFSDENANANSPPSAAHDEEAQSKSKSFVRSIIDMTRNKENKKEPGPWNKAHDKKKEKLFNKAPTKALGFDILEDESVAKSEETNTAIVIDRPFKPFPNFKSKNRPLPEWITPVTIENTAQLGILPEYNKCKLYPRPNKEYQIEELLAYNWFRKRGITNRFTQMRDEVWKSYELGPVRQYPNFAKKSLPQKIDKRDLYYVPERNTNLAVNFNALYNIAEKTEMQIEEVMAQRWKSGERKLKYDPNLTVLIASEMEETVCISYDNDKVQRRKSFFPSRKSMAPINSMSTTSGLPRATNTHVQQNNDMIESEESQKEHFSKAPTKSATQSESADFVTDFENKSRKPNLHKSFEDLKLYNDNEQPSTSAAAAALNIKYQEKLREETTAKAEKESISPATLSESIDQDKIDFKAPVVPVTGRKITFETYEESNDERPSTNPGQENLGYFDADEICSTQTFNLFIKSQAVSTPNASQKTTSRVFGTILKDKTDPEPFVEISPVASEPAPHELADAKVCAEGGALNYSFPYQKQLSTILETSEQGTNTKSSVGSPKTDSSVAKSGHVPLSKLCLETVKEQSTDIASKSDIYVVQPPPSQHTCLQKPSNRNFAIFEDPTEADVLTKQGGNFSRHEQREDTGLSCIIPETQPCVSEQSAVICQQKHGGRNFSIFEDPTETDILSKQGGNLSRQQQREATGSSCIIPETQPCVSEQSAVICQQKHGGRNFSIFEDPTETDILSKQGGNFSRQQQREDTGSSCIIPETQPFVSEHSALICQQESGKQVCNLPRLEQHEDTGSSCIITEMKPPVPKTPANMRLQNLSGRNFSIFEDRTDTDNLAKLKVGNFSRLEQREDTIPSYNIPPVKFQEDKTETITKIMLTSKQDNKFQDDKTENTSEIIFATAPRTPFVKDSTESKLPFKPPTAIDKSSSVEDSFEFFTKTPPRAGTSSKLAAKKPSILNDVEHTNFDVSKDSPVFSTSKIFCDYDTPICREKTLLCAKDAESSEKVLLAKNFQKSFKNVNTAFSKSANSQETPESITEMKNKLRDSFMPELSFIEKAQPQSQKLGMKPQNSEDDPMDTKKSQHSENSSKLFSQPLSSATQKQREPFRSVLRDSFDLADFSIVMDSQPAHTTISNCITPEIDTHKHILTDSFMKDFSAIKEPSPSAPTRKSIRPETKKGTEVSDYFDLNAETAEFIPNLSIIKNSTFLMYDAKQRHTMFKEKSLHIKDEPVDTEENSLETFRASEKSIRQQQNTQNQPKPKPELSTNLLKPFKIPAAVMPAHTMKDESDVHEADDDANLSIYRKQPVKTPQIQRHVWSDSIEDQAAPNYFVHIEPDLNETQQTIEKIYLAANVNPFDSNLINAFLEQINFTGYISELPTCELIGKVTQLHKDSIVKVNNVQFKVQKLVGEGRYGAVYVGTETTTGKKYALKQERPPNFWEYYICLEVNARLNVDEMIPAFMSVDYARIGMNASILVTPFSPYGSLINVCNKIKDVTTKNVDECVVMHLTCLLLEIIDHLHAMEIIHADIKADNFLLMEKLSHEQSHPPMRLIDFGISIDMQRFKKGQTFSYKHRDKSIRCVEMRENRPWTYQLDLYGLAGVIHVLLFGKYMDVHKTANGYWMHTTYVPRYLNKTLWETIFRTLLNIRDCSSMPNLQNLRVLLKEEIAERENLFTQKILEFNRALDY